MDPDRDGGIRPEKQENSAKSGIVGMYANMNCYGHHRSSVFNDF